MEKTVEELKEKNPGGNPGIVFGANFTVITKEITEGSFIRFSIANSNEIERNLTKME